MTLLRRPSSRAATHLVLWGAWAALLALQLGAVARFGADVPLADEWDVLPLAQDRAPAFAELWRPHGNVHRLPLPRLVYLALGRATDWDFRAPMVFNALALGALAAGALWVAARLRGRPALTDLFLPLLFLHGSLLHDVLFGFQLTFLLGTLLAGGVLFALLAAPGPGGAASTIAIAAAMLLGPLCGANGALVAAALAAWVLVTELVGLARGRRVGPRRPRLLALVALATVVLVVAYAVGLETRGEGAAPPNARILARTTFQFLASGVGPVARWGWPVSAGVAVALVTTLLLLLARRAARRPAERWVLLGLIALALGWIGMSVAVAFGRGGLAWSAGFARRYVVLAAPLCAWVYLVSLRLDPAAAAGRALRGALCVLLVAIFPRDLEHGLEWAREQHAVRASFERAVRVGARPSLRLVRAQLVRDFVSEAGLYPRPSSFRRGLEILERGGLGPFRRDAEPAVPSVVVVVAEGWARATPLPRVDALAAGGVRFAASTLGSADRSWLAAPDVFPEERAWRPGRDGEREFRAWLGEVRAPFCVAVHVLDDDADAGSSDAEVDAALGAVLDALRARALSESSAVLLLGTGADGPDGVVTLVASWPAVLRGPIEDDEPLAVGPFLRELVAGWRGMLAER